MEKGIQASIFEYSDYRKFLADYYLNRKAASATYSHRQFAKQAGLSSPSHLLMIIKGERNLSIKTIPKFVDGLKLGTKERKFFELLVVYSQTDDLQIKAKVFADIMQIKSSIAGLHRLEKEKFDFLSKWYVVAIYVMVGLKDFKADPAWIVKRLGNKILVSQAKEALTNLLNLKMIEVDKIAGLKQASGAITVADDTRSIAVFNYHQSMIRLAEEALKTKAPSLREMNGATVSIPLDKLAEVKERIRNFRKEINQLAASYEDSDEVYQLNIQFFPLTSKDDQS